MTKRTYLSATDAADELARHSPKLREFTTQAAVALGAWMGANDAIQECRRRGISLDPVVGIYSSESALMAVLRVYALFDRDPSKVSYQRVHAYLKRDDVKEELCRRAAANLVPSERVGELIHLFRETYGLMKWEVHGRLMHLRNVGLAHLTEQDVRRGITFDELERLVTLACHLCKDLDMISAGLNTEPDTWLGHWADAAYEFWREYVQHRHGVALPPRHLAGLIQV